MPDKKVKRLKSSRLSVNKRFINTLMKRTKSESADKLEALRQKIREKYRRLTPAKPKVPHYEDNPNWRYDSDNDHRQEEASRLSQRKNIRRRSQNDGMHASREEEEEVNEQSNRLVVFNIGDATRELLHDVFRPCGEISSLKIILDKETGSSRGFGFVEFYKDEDARHAFEVCNGLTVDGHSIRVQYSSRSKDYESRSLRKGRSIQERLSSGRDRKHKTPIKMYNRGGKLMKNNDVKVVKPDPLMLLHGIPHLAKSFVAGVPSNFDKETTQMSGNVDSAISMLVSEAKQQNATPFSVPDKSIITLELEKEMETYYAPTEQNELASSGVMTASAVSTVTNQFPINNNTGETYEENAVTKEEELKKQQETAYANAVTSLYYYWDVVRENPHDFDGWTILLGHAETMEMEDHLRSGFEGFLPYYPYCYGYWEKLSEVELKSQGMEKCLGVLLLAIECVPMNEHLWLVLFKNYVKYVQENNHSIASIRSLYEHGLDNIGLSWNSSKFWEECIEYEINHNNLRQAFSLYRRLLHIPMKLTNKHFDCIIAFLHNFNPRYYLPEQEYQNLRMEVCEKLHIRYDPMFLRPKAGYQGKHPEDLINEEVKQIIYEECKKLNDVNVSEMNKRWLFEERILRPFFHVRSIEKRQLKNWNDYLDFEIKEGDPVRIISLFERCLVSVALYEEYWSRYAKYLETYVTECIREHSSRESNTKGDEKEKEQEQCENNTEENKSEKQSSNNKKISLQRKNFFYREEFEPSPEMIDTNFNRELEDAGISVMDLKYQFCSGINVGNFVLKSPPLNKEWIKNSMTWEEIRHVYRRAVWVHCPNKPFLLIQWAEFEINQGEVKSARDLLNNTLEKVPNCLKARMLLIQLELQEGNKEQAEELFMKGFKTLSSEKDLAWLATKYSRFLFKNKQESQKSLSFLRKALKKYRNYPYLYHLLFDICYEQVPIDRDGALASLQLALASKDVNTDDKLWFSFKKLGYLIEHGNIKEIKDARQQYLKLKNDINAEMLKKQKKEAKEKAKVDAMKVDKTEAKQLFSHKVPPINTHLHPERFFEAQTLMEYFYPRPYYMPYMYTQNQSDPSQHAQNNLDLQKNFTKDGNNSAKWSEEAEMDGKMKKVKALCKYGKMCQRPDCMFRHKPRCSYGWRCRKNNCDFWHDTPGPRPKNIDDDATMKPDPRKHPFGSIDDRPQDNIVNSSPSNEGMNQGMANINSHLTVHHEFQKPSSISFPTNPAQGGTQRNHYCNVCMTDFINAKQFAKHLDSSPVHRLEALLVIQAENPLLNRSLEDLKHDEAFLRTLCDPTDTCRCFVCKINTGSMRTYKTHIKGKKHEKEVTKIISCCGGVTNMSKQCNICNIDFSVNISPEQYLQHMESPYHQFVQQKTVQSLGNQLFNACNNSLQNFQSPAPNTNMDIPAINHNPNNEICNLSQIRRVCIIHDGIFSNLGKYLNIKDKSVEIYNFSCESILEITNNIEDIVGPANNPVFIIHTGSRQINSKDSVEYADDFINCAYKIKKLYMGCSIGFVLLLPSKFNSNAFETKRLQFNEVLRAKEGYVYETIQNGEFDVPLDKMFTVKGDLSEAGYCNISTYICNFLNRT